MSAAVPPREDFYAADLRQLARASRDAGQSRRLLAVAAIYEGGGRSEAALIGAVGLQTVRDWVMAFNASGPAGLIDRKAPGNAPKLDVAQRQALARVIEVGPDPERHGVVRWRLKDLAAWVYASFGISLDERTVGRTVKALGFAKLTARPRHHEQDPAALTAFKKPARSRKRCPRRSATGHGHRDLVAGRGPCRPEEPPAAALGTARDTARSA